MLYSINDYYALFIRAWKFSFCIKASFSNGESGNEAVDVGYCPTNCNGTYYNPDDEVQVYTFNDDGPIFGSNGEYELDPENSKCSFKTLQVFGICKNNCPGVNFPVVAGGFALLTSIVGVGAASSLSSIPAGAIGLLGLGGYSMVSQQMCIGPVYCQARSGECCLLVYIFNRGLVCPARCNEDFDSKQDGVRDEIDDIQDGYSLLDIFQVTFASYLVRETVQKNKQWI